MSVDIRIRDLKFSYFEAHPILHIPSLDIKAGEFIFLYGPSGSGKSTLMDVILGLLAPTGGEISIDGEPLTEQNVGRWRAIIGYVPQDIEEPEPFCFLTPPEDQDEIEPF
jgi:ABC-type bacteriocin/lantibiotic exporter with double-glycine peptidase domain